MKRLSNVPRRSQKVCGVPANCGTSAYRGRFGSLQVCPHCGFGLRLTASERLAQLCDCFDPWDEQLELADSDFPGYMVKRAQAQAASGSSESVRCGQAVIAAQPCALAVMDSYYMMGSLGQVAGERLCRLFERATAQRLAVVIVTASGGARMQEGIQSLMQMAKISAARALHVQAGLPYLSC